MRLLPVIAILVLAVLTTGTIEEQAITQEEVVVTVDSTNLRFSPESVTITEGDSVRFFWSGELLAHNAVSYDGLFDSGDASRNVDYSFTFEVGTNGTHEYLCEPHEEFGMTGAIVVQPLTIEEEEDPEGDDGAEPMPAAGLLGTAIMALGAAMHSKKRD
ncbi:MAG: plastocyanin/azurin family copper-binding protein [Candidatus Thalassarchaeaceae archaeon]|nr:plastocyanin/azurin family copper-binding protein [Candidatus Thalassarchaeaceae archaeon]